MSNQEQFHDRHNNIAENSELGSEALDNLRKEKEKQLEGSIDNAKDSAEQARVEALKTAVSIENVGKKVEKTAQPRPGTINKKQKNESFKRTMKRVQSELPIAERLFSKVIHNKTVEKTSDIIGSSIARPNLILSGAFSAFLLTLITYWIAKRVGYQLSGSETIIAFIIGWLIGIAYDYLRLLFTGKK